MIGVMSASVTDVFALPPRSAGGEPLGRYRETTIGMGEAGVYFTGNFDPLVHQLKRWWDRPQTILQRGRRK